MFCFYLFSSFVVGKKVKHLSLNRYQTVIAAGSYVSLSIPARSRICITFHIANLDHLLRK